mmetsp:Transcript_30998/g.65758  ORF Transcript_30998/g.65758 Transcript_30998/m.65758 type:complete len:337 (+) Transcript_30998:401-1411(+)
MIPDWWFFVAANILSGLGSLWLLCRCLKCDTLVARQFAQLALANLLYILLPSCVLITGCLLEDPDWFGLCRGNVGLVHLCEFASSLIEVHIALGLTAAVFRWRRVLDILYASLLWIWLGALFLAGIDTPSTHVMVLASEPVLQRCTNTSPVCSVVLAMCLLMVCVLYIAGLVKSCRVVGENAMKRVVLRAVCYPLTYSLTYGLLVVYNLGITSWATRPALILVGFNGFANAVMYSLVDIGLVATSRRSAFLVTFRPWTSIIEPSVAGDTSRISSRMTSDSELPLASACEDLLTLRLPPDPAYPEVTGSHMEAIESTDQQTDESETPELTSMSASVV